MSLRTPNPKCPERLCNCNKDGECLILLSLTKRRPCPFFKLREGRYEHTYADWLETVMGRFGTTNDELAAVAGVHRNSIWLYRSGKMKPSQPVKERIDRFFEEKEREKK